MGYHIATPSSKDISRTWFIVACAILQSNVEMMKMLIFSQPLEAKLEKIKETGNYEKYNSINIEHIYIGSLWYKKIIKNLNVQVEVMWLHIMR